MNTSLLLLLVISVFSSAHAQKIDFDKRLKELGVELYSPTKPMANYVKVVRTRPRTDPRR